MKSTGWREAPLFVLEGLDTLGREVLNRLHRVTAYQPLFDTVAEERAEVWRCWLGRSACLSALPVVGEGQPWPERDGVRDLLIVVGEGPLPERVMGLANHVILVLPDQSGGEADNLHAFLAQWFDGLTSPGLIQLDWKDVRGMLEPGLPGYAACAKVAGCELAGEAGKQVHDRLKPFVARACGPGGFLVTIAAGEDFGLDTFSTVGEAINPLIGEMDDFIMVTVLKEQVELEVWGMVNVRCLSQEESRDEFALSSDL